MRVFTIVKAALAPALFFCPGAAAQDSTPYQNTIFRDIWEAPDPQSVNFKTTVEFKYVDYTDSDLISTVNIKRLEYAVSFLHTKKVYRYSRVPRVYVKGRDGNDAPIETTFPKYMIFNLRNRLLSEGINIGPSEKYLGFAPLEAAVDLTLYKNATRGLGRFELLVFAGRKGKDPLFNKRFSCHSENGFGGPENAYGRTLEPCIKEVVDRALADKKLRAFLNAE